MILTVIYFAALTVIVIAAIVAALHSEIPLGPFGLTLLCGVAVFALLGVEYSPRQWITGLLGCLAALVVVVFYRWRRYAAEQKRRAAMRCRRATDQPRTNESTGGAE
jgi:cadmium resistance protein CadD (predicted permease)